MKANRVVSIKADGITLAECLDTTKYRAKNSYDKAKETSLPL